ncbi:Small subunit (SSU) processome component [Tulasnella sp. 427]|nr:Small subunit (SSU) processome component [Tulasnella sp. 427]
MSSSVSPETPPSHAFPKATQPQIIRAHQKDFFHFVALREQIDNVLRSWLGTRWLLRWAPEVEVLTQLTYGYLGGVKNTQSLGEEYVDIWQYSSTTPNLPNTKLRTFLLLCSTLPQYLVSHLRRRLGNQGRVSRWLAALPNLVELVSEINLAAFYLFGTYYDFTKRIFRIRQITTIPEDPLNPAPTYSFLGILLALRLLHRLYSFLRTVTEPPEQSTMVSAEDEKTGQTQTLQPVMLDAASIAKVSVAVKQAESSTEIVEPEADPHTLLDVAQYPKVMSIVGSSKSRATNKSEFFQDVAATTTYSPQGDYFLYLSLAIDKHRLRVYDTGSGKAIAEHVVDDGRVTATCWHRVEEAVLQDGGDGEGNSRKRRKKSSKKTDATGSGKTALVAVLGLSNGTLLLFSPARNSVVQTVSQASSTTAVLSVSASPLDPGKLWTSSADGSIRGWDLSTSKVFGTWQQAERAPYSSIALRPTENKDGNTQLLAGHHTIALLSLQSPTSPSTTDIQQPVVIATFTGHASPVTSLQWDPTSPDRFISIADNDRIAQVWKLQSEKQGGAGQLVATIPLDSTVRSLGFPAIASPASRTLFALSDSGNLSLLSLPAKLGESGKKSNFQVKVLQSQCAVSTKTPPADSSGQSARIIAAQFVEALGGHVNVARVVSMRPIFETIRFAEDDGTFIPQVQLEHEPVGVFHDGGETEIDRPRYSDKSAGVRSGAALPESADFDDEPEGIDAELDADMAELTLGQRLKALRADRQADGEGEGPSDAEGPHPSEGRLSGITLTRTLTQALHSNDKQLLETCLQTADERVVKGTVEGLLQQHVVPLLDMLVERLAKGGSGGVGGASTDYASTIVVWIRVVLFVHAAFLMTQPDLVKKLASLHATLVARSALQDRLQMLNGRLDLIFSQLRLRRYDAAKPSTSKSRRKAMLYVEGDSSDEEEVGMDLDGDVEIEDDDDEGSIEDVELGGLGDEVRRFRKEESSDEDEDEDDEDDESDEDGSGSDLAGFIDEEAEESDGDGDGSPDVSEEEE